MLAIIGKASPRPDPIDERDRIEYYLRDFRKMLGKKEKFTYAWSFNPDRDAIDRMTRAVEQKEEMFLYLPNKDGGSSLRMRVERLHHNRAVGGTCCPQQWKPYCIQELRDRVTLNDKPPYHPIHIWFLMASIERLDPPTDLRYGFTPVFKDKYTTWGRNFFAFLRG